MYYSRSKLRVPLSVAARPDGTAEVSWLVDRLGDLAAEILIRVDGDEGVLRSLSSLELTEPILPGDFLEVGAEIVHWSETGRQIAFHVQKLGGTLPGATSDGSAGMWLTHPKSVCTARALYDVSKERRRVQDGPDPVVIIAAPVGWHTTRGDTPYLPLTPEEIAADVARCVVEGATVVHLHVRDEAGNPTLSLERFQEPIQRILQRCDVLVQVSTEGDASLDVITRCQPVGAGGDLVSIATGTVNRGDHIYFNSKPLMEHLAIQASQASVTPVFEIFDLGFMENVKLLAKKGLVSLPSHFQFVLGARGGMGARRNVMDLLVDSLPRGSTWSAAGVGRHQMPMAELAVRRGGHVRVGIADNLYVRKKELSQGSAPLVARVVEFARTIGRPVADLATARRVLQCAR